MDEITVVKNRIKDAEWVNGRWNGQESVLAKCILSSSEPTILLSSPDLWPNDDNGRIIGDIERFVSLDQQGQRKEIYEILNKGLSENDVILGGCLFEYTHDKEIIGMSLLHKDVSSWVDSTINNLCERNARLFLKCRGDFISHSHHHCRDNSQQHDAKHASVGDKIWFPGERQDQAGDIHDPAHIARNVVGDPSDI